MKHKIFLILILLSCLQAFSQPKGSLFIIGGGSRSPELMQALMQTVHLSVNDYIVILPMATEEPDTAFYYISKDLIKVCSNRIVNFNFTSNDISKPAWLDSLKHAKLVFITGGDQSRFINI